MSDSNFSKNTPNKDEPWADALVDTLLRETADGGASTEAFLASVENAIDAENDPTSKVVPIAKPNPRRLWMWSSGIAAVLVIGVSAWLASVQIREERQMIAHTVTFESEPGSEAAMMEKLELKRSPETVESQDELQTFIRMKNEYGLPNPPVVSNTPEPIKIGDAPGNDVLSSLDVPEANFMFESELSQIGIGGFSKEGEAKNNDSYSVAASGSGEGSVRQRMSYYDTAYDHNRVKILSEIAEGWEAPVPKSIAALEPQRRQSNQTIGHGGTSFDSSITLEGAESQSTNFGLVSEAITGRPISQESASVPGIAGTNRYTMTGQNGGEQPVVSFTRGGTISAEGNKDFGRIEWDNSTAALGSGGTVIVSKNTESKASALPTLLEKQTAVRPGLESSNFGNVALHAIAATPDMKATGDLVATDDLIVRLELPVVGKAFASTARPNYGELIDNPWFAPIDAPLSTFSIDVDTASWTNLRAMIRSGRSADAIPNDAVRIEELINYFSWDYPQPDGEHPFAFATETADCPWNRNHRLMRVGIQGREIAKTDRPAANLVFLLDVSGSMDKPNKLPLVKRAISVLVEKLKEHDTVSIVVYAGAEGLALQPTSGRDQVAIQDALDNLDAGGSTNGGAGIKLAYRMAREQFVEGGINRVILCTDGDFNVGTTGTEELVSLVEKEAKSGVFLSVCGFGQDNLNDAMLEEITNKGNGNYAYIDNFREARKVFLQDLMGTLVTIAKDVKIQIEFNPAEVAGYRLIGYANRKLEAEDFENDEIDAGEVGSGHAVTALYEIVPAGAKGNPADDEIGLRYQAKNRPTPKRKLIPSGELALLKLRYKLPDGEQSILMEQPVMPGGGKWNRASEDFRFASAVGLFGMILREHESAGDADLADVIDIANEAKGNDPQGWRAEFVDLVKQLADR